MKLTSKFSICALAFIVSVTGVLTGCSESGDNEVKINPETGEKIHEISILGIDTGNEYIKWEERENYSSWRALEEMLEEQNIFVDYEVVTAEQYEVVIQTRLASGNDLPDIIKVHTLDNASVLKLADQGVILPLNDYIEQYSNGNINHMYDEIYTSAKPLTLTPDGELYWFSNLHMKTYQNEPAPFGLTINYRKDWTDALGIEEPTNLDEFYEMLVAFREKDANGNGIPDEILNISISSFGNAVAQWFGLGTSITTYDPVTNTIVSPWLQDGVKDYFEFIRKLVDEGIIDSSLVGSGEMTTQRMAENKIGATYDYAAGAWLPDMVNTEGAVFQPLKPIDAIEGIDPRVITEPYDLVWDKYAITNACEDIEGVIKLFDIIYSEEYAVLSNWGVEGETFVEEEGVKYYIPDMANEEYVEQGTIMGRLLWSGVLPRVQMANLESEIIVKEPEAAQYLKDVVTYEPWYPNFNTNYLAMPTDEETEAINEIRNNLLTYSQELCIKLALSQTSLDDWDEYIKEFEELGLQTLIEIEQERLNRFLANKK